MAKKSAIALDVGGTSLKSAIVSSDGYILEGSIRQTAIDSKSSYEKIIGTFIEPMAALLRLAQAKQLKIIGIGIGMPGPFDYDNGICLMKGVDKYESIYGVNLREKFRERLKLTKNFPILLENDAWTFVRGEAWLGAGKGFKRIIGLTLGTGLGSGFINDADIVTSGAGVPPGAWIGGTKYGNGIVDDRISRRGIIKRYLELNPDKTKQIDVKKIATKANQGDVPARQVFEETGIILGQILKPIAEAFDAECIVLGGKIARSFHLFAPALEEAFKPSKLSVKIASAKNIEQSALLGAGRFLFRGWDKITYPKSI